jgi:hypothetical protein
MFLKNAIFYEITLDKTKGRRRLLFSHDMVHERENRQCHYSTSSLRLLKEHLVLLSNIVLKFYILSFPLLIIFITYFCAGKKSMFLIT